MLRSAQRQCNGPCHRGVSAADYSRSLESKIRNGEKETKANSFKEPASSDPWQSENQTIPQVTGMYLNGNQTQSHIPFCRLAGMLCYR